MLWWRILNTKTSSNIICLLLFTAVSQLYQSNIISFWFSLHLEFVCRITNKKRSSRSPQRNVFIVHKWRIIAYISFTRTWLNWNILYVGRSCLQWSQVITYSLIMSYFCIVCILLLLCEPEVLCWNASLKFLVLCFQRIIINEGNNVLYFSVSINFQTHYNDLPLGKNEFEQNGSSIVLRKVFYS